MNDKQLREAMAERGHEMTPAELRAEKESIVRKIEPRLLDECGMIVDEALDYILAHVRVIK